jgi:hypothetical protein
MADFDSRVSLPSSEPSDLKDASFTKPVQFKDKEWHDIHQAWQEYSGKLERATWPHTSQVGGTTMDVIVLRDDAHPKSADWQVQPFGLNMDDRYTPAPDLEKLIGQHISFRACFGNYCLLLIDMDSIKPHS